jgi:hypothetical protein
MSQLTAGALDEMDAFPGVAGGNDVLLMAASHLSLSEMANSLRVCKAWRSIFDGTPHLWRSLCERTWRDKAYVPESLRALAGRDFASEDDTQQAELRQRQNLMGLRIAELKQMMRRLRVQVNTADLIEKGDFADAILESRLKVAAVR